MLKNKMTILKEILTFNQPIVEKTCPGCSGKGKVKTHTTSGGTIFFISALIILLVESLISLPNISILAWLWFFFLSIIGVLTLREYKQQTSNKQKAKIQNEKAPTQI